MLSVTLSRLGVFVRSLAERDDVTSGVLLQPREDTSNTDVLTNIACTMIRHEVSA